MRLDELNAEPFVVKMLRSLLKKEEPVLMVIVQDDGTESTLGRITSFEVDSFAPTPDKPFEVYTFNVYTNVSKQYSQPAGRLQRADIRQKHYPNKWGPLVPALYVPASGNNTDLGGHDL
jgi:hypothetical protein